MKISVFINQLLALIFIIFQCSAKAQDSASARNDSSSLIFFNSVHNTDTVYQPVQVSILPMIGTSYQVPGTLITDYSFNVLGGKTHGVRKLELATLFNIDLGDVSYFQMAGVSNLVTGNSKGIQIGGIANCISGNLQGIQFAGIGNLVKGKSNGAQIGGIFNLNIQQSNLFQVAGIVNLNKDTSSGIQIAGILNAADHRYQGVQIAGIANVNGDKSSGSMIAGIGNKVKGDFDGLQISGLYNVVAGSINGSQVSGLVNISKKVQGNQIGVFNISDSISGVPMGFFSYANNGYHKFELSSNEIFYANASFITGVNAFHNIFTASVKPTKGGDLLWSFGYGAGSNIILSKQVSLVLDVTANQISKGEFLNKLNLLNKGYLGVEVRLSNKISISTGPELNVWVTKTNYTDYPNILAEIHPNVFYHDISNDDKIDLKMWIGWKVGFRFF